MKEFMFLNINIQNLLHNSMFNLFPYFVFSINFEVNLYQTNGLHTIFIIFLYRTVAIRYNTRI